MLVIPMWLEIECCKKEEEDAIVSFRYSPRIKMWWWHDWDEDICTRAWDITSDIRSPKDLLTAEQDIIKMYDELELRDDNHAMSYTWCRWDGVRTRPIWERYYPAEHSGQLLPWSCPSTVLTYDWDPDYGAHFFYGDQYQSCVLDIFQMDSEVFSLFGIIIENQRLAWRHVTGRRCGETAEDKPIYFTKVTQWVFHDEVYKANQSSTPIQVTFRKELRKGEVLKDDMTKYESERTGVSLFLRPDPRSEPLY